MSTDVIEAARRRLAVLRTEMEQLEAFIEMGERISDGKTGPIDSAVLRLSGRRTGGIGSTPRKIVQAVYEILSATPDIVDKDALVERLAAKDVTITGLDARKNLGTILWRNKDLFEHVQGVGYRWTGVFPKGQTKCET